MSFAVISGGGTGIGAAVARVLARDGYDMAIVGRRGDVLDKAAAEISALAGRPGGVTPVVADLTVPASVDGVAAQLDGRTVDVLVNNAGGYLAQSGDGLDGVADFWRRNLDANLLSAVLLTTALQPRLARPGGRVLLLSSIAAQRGGAGPYSAAKAGLHGWAYDLARELGPDGITVNVVSPGYIANTEFFGGRMTPAGHERRVAETLVGRAGEPDDIAAAVRWLVGPGGGYVTGQVINVNGGSVLG